MVWRGLSAAITRLRAGNIVYLKRGILITRSIKPVFADAGIDRDHTKCDLIADCGVRCNLLSLLRVPMLQSVT